MAPKNRIIIDTDPGVDDVLALLLALSASPEDLEIAMISVTYGNVPLQSCLRNVVALFHVVEKELAWRRANGKAEGFEAFRTFKPVVACGAEHPLEDDELAADHFHGADGLHNVHETHPDLSPADTWRHLFDKSQADGPAASGDPPACSKYFTPSKQLAHREMLRILKENPEDTVTIVAVGPLTNVALAASEDPETFLRVKELVVMGGSVHVPGNITPVGEFNCYADAVAAARVYALTSPNPASTMPPSTKRSLPPYPPRLSKRLKLSLFPLDITTPHLLNKDFFSGQVKPLIEEGSPLAKWVGTFMFGTFAKIESMVDEEPGLSLHDPLCIWYMMTRSDPAWRPVPKPEDIRVETVGQWSRGMHMIDGRGRKSSIEDPAEAKTKVATQVSDSLEAVELDQISWDKMGWCSEKRGNRINRVVESPGEKIFAQYLLNKVFPMAVA